MDRERSSGWEGELRCAAGRALLRVAPAPLTAKELALATGRDPSNLRRLATDLVEEGLLCRRPPEAVEGALGRRASVAFTFAAGEQEKLEAHLADRTEVGRLGPGQQLVSVEVGAKGLGGLFEVLSEAEVMARASWSALCDGPRQELLIAFSGDGAIDASFDLMGVLSAAELKVSRSAVGKVETATDLVRTARRSLQAIAGTEERRGARPARRLSHKPRSV